MAAGGHIGYGALGSSVVRAAPLNPHFYGPIAAQVAHLPVCMFKTGNIFSVLIEHFFFSLLNRIIVKKQHLHVIYFHQKLHQFIHLVSLIFHQIVHRISLLITHLIKMRILINNKKKVMFLILHQQISIMLRILDQ